MTFVRPPTRADLLVLAEIEVAGDRQFADWFGHDPGWDPPPSGEHRAAEPGFLLVAAEKAGGPAVGFVHVLELEGWAHLEQVSVRPERQRRGHGRTLVEAAKAGAAERGHERISLMTYADVPWNAPFYATCAFVEAEPAAPLHRRLVEVERALGLDRHGRRVLMVARLTADRVTNE